MNPLSPERNHLGHHILSHYHDNGLNVLLFKKPHRFDGGDKHSAAHKKEHCAADQTSPYVHLHPSRFLSDEGKQWHIMPDELEVWCVWSTGSSHQTYHLFVWVLVWHNSSWNAIRVWSFLSRRTKAKEWMDRKNKWHSHLDSLHRCNIKLTRQRKSHKSKVQLQQRKKKNRRINENRICLLSSRMDIS